MFGENNPPKLVLSTCTVASEQCIYCKVLSFLLPGEKKPGLHPLQVTHPKISYCLNTPN